MRKRKNNSEKNNTLYQFLKQAKIVQIEYFHFNNFLMGFLLSLDLLPINEHGYPQTKEFLLSVIEICLDFIKKSNDRTTKVLDFHQPSEMKELFDFSIPDDPLDVKQLIFDCAQTLKYQVKTGEWKFS